jgi:rSAM/selenodomain-associated transferase 2
MRHITPRDISVIIPALNEQPGVGRAIRSAWHTGAGEVLVVDGGSCDETPRIAEQLGASVFRSAPGRARQQNVGAARAKGAILLFQHADCWLGSNCLHQVARVLNDTSDTVAGAFRQRIDGSGFLYRALEHGNAARAGRFGIAYGDQGIFVRRAIFEQLGGFAQVPLMEDVMLMRRLRGCGRIVLLPGPLHVSSRRWQRQGVIRQTARNWCLLAAYFCGVPPASLARHYPRHDQ